ncbi:MAG: tRNA threonylcarbamoyladenosine biosynthesis protein TsaB [Patescibacteria group bacterium]|nr:tRNA threonylcarbamoyladenosine biosynthesis protein TsaB [Patescibacteria group bacterium]
MIFLSIKTDQPKAEVALLVEGEPKVELTWEAHRQLAETLHSKIAELLKANHRTLKDLDGIVCYKGPGSFTGLRIGMSVGNALAYGLGIPVVGAAGSDWQEEGVARLATGENEKSALPEYGGEIHITKPRK